MYLESRIRLQVRRPADLEVLRPGGQSIRVRGGGVCVSADPVG